MRSEDWVNEHWFLPEDAICPNCNKIFRDHPGVADVLEAHNISRKQALISGGFCRCAHARDISLHAQILRYANIPHAQNPRNFDNFDPVPGSQDGMRIVRLWAERDDGPPIIRLSGSTGTGKSHLLEAAARSMVAQNKLVKYEFVPTLLDRLRATQGANAEEDDLTVVGYYQAAYALILDDLGADRPTPFAQERLTSLFDARYRQERKTAIATNLTREKIADQYGERLASRLYDAHSGIVEYVTMTCGDYRTGQ